MINKHISVPFQTTGGRNKFFQQKIIFPHRKVRRRLVFCHGSPCLQLEVIHKDRLAITLTGDVSSRLLPERTDFLLLGEPSTPRWAVRGKWLRKLD